MMKICDEWAKWGGGAICAPKDGAPLKRVKAALGEEELASGGRRLLDMHVAHLGKRAIERRGARQTLLLLTLEQHVVRLPPGE